MGQKKRRGLIIAIIIFLIIILLLIAEIAYLYLFTDLLKTNKQLFFQYAVELVEEQDGFIDNAVMQYIQRKQSSPYETNGEFTLDISIPSIEDSLQIVNDFNITYSGKTDASNAKSESEISINYSDSVNFPFTYRKINNLTGIQTQYISSNFVAVRNDEELSGAGELNRLIKLQNFEFSNEELRNLKTTYFDNILNQLEDSKFSKLTEGELTGYRLTLTEEELKNILIQMLEALKTDETSLNKINEIGEILGITSQFDSGTIEDLIATVQDDLEINGDVELTVYQNGGNLNRIDIGIGANLLTINKEGNGQEITYSASISSTENEENNSTFDIKYTGLGTDNVTENYEIAYEGTDNSTENSISTYQYTITNNITFVNSVEIEDLTDDNAVILNDRDEEYVTNLMSVIEERLTEVNRLQMEELGIAEEANPIQLILSSIFITGGTSTNLTEQEINAFNEKFELYQSTNTTGATVKGLLTTIQNNNETEGNNQIEEINFDGEEYDVTDQNITYLKSTINVEDAYRVEFEKDSSTGLIYRAVINKR